MNTFEQVIGKEILEIIRVDFQDDYDENSLIAVFLKLDSNSGLFIENGTNEMTEIKYIMLDELREEFESEYQSRLNSLKATDQLNKLIGLKICAIKLGEHKQDKYESESFVVSSGGYSEVQIEFENLNLSIFQKDRRQRISIKVSFFTSKSS